MRFEFAASQTAAGKLGTAPSQEVFINFWNDAF